MVIPKKEYNIYIWDNAKKNFSLFLLEAEFRFNMNKAKVEEKMNTIKIIFKEIYYLWIFKFSEIEDI